MDADLQDLLALWLGDHDPGEVRRDALLCRLRDDTAFRQAFVEELRLVGMLKAVQSPEPRWLRLEDVSGWSAKQRPDVEALARRVIGQGEKRLRLRRWFRLLLAATAAAIMLGAGFYLIFRETHSQPVSPDKLQATNGEVAAAVLFHGVEWEPSDGAHPREGDVVKPGHLRLRAGRLTLAFFSGVALTVEGPADLELVAPNRVVCRHGKLRACVPAGAEGFTVLAPGYEVVDLGTEFGLNLEPGGKARVMVFEGEAAVSVLGKDGRSVGGALLEGRRSVEIDPDAGRIQDVPPQPEAFVPLGRFVPGPLELAPNYADEILAARPWGYWRFESLADGRVPNEVAEGPALRALGGVELEQAPGGNHYAHFRLDDAAQAFLMDGEWTPPRADSYAVELWSQADLPSASAFGQSALVGLIAAEEGKDEKHVTYLELAGRGRRSPHEPCAVRFLDRWPASVSGGANVFSRRTVVPSLWHHIVGQKAGNTLELYVDGVCVGTSPAMLNANDPDDVATTACRLLVGRLKQKSKHAPEIRAFEGRLDELALYERALTPEEVRRHAGLRVAP
jgi:hypothetical protein